jgi:hypothetical protein
MYPTGTDVHGQRGAGADRQKLLKTRCQMPIRLLYGKGQGCH